MSKQQSLKYYRMKFVKAMIFADDKEDYKDILIKAIKIEDEDFYRDLYSYFEAYTFDNLIDENNKKELIILLKEILNISKNKVITNIIESLIDSLLKLEKDNSLSLFRNELIIRKANNKFKNEKEVPDSVILLYQPYLRKMFEFDLLLALTHTDLIDDEIFKKEYLIAFILEGNTYIEGIRKMDKDKDLFDEAVFKNRLLMVLEYKKDNSNLSHKEQKELKKILREKK